MNTSSNRLKRAGWALAAIAASVAIYLLLPRASQHVSELSPRPSAQSEPRAAAPASNASVRKTIPPRETVHLDRLIDDVRVEKSTLCRGEDFQVTVTGASEDPGVLFSVDGVFGNDFILNASTRDNVQEHWIVATDMRAKRDYRKVSVQVLDADDARCRSQRLAQIVVTDDENRLDGKRFEARPVRGLRSVRSVEWTFGDGEGETTSGPVAYHGYGSRPQDSEASSFVVTALVTDSAGKRAFARATVWFRNTYYLSRKYAGNRPQPTDYDRFQFGGGTGAVPVRVTNIDSHAIEFKRAVMTQHPCKGGVEPVREEIPASDVTEGATIGTGDTKELVLQLSARWVDRDTCRLGIELVGDTIPPTTGTQPSGGGPRLQPVNASVQLEIRRPLTVAEGGDPSGASQLIDDPEVVTKLRRAMEQKKKGHLTSDELDDVLGEDAAGLSASLPSE